MRARRLWAMVSFFLVLFLVFFMAATPISAGPLPANGRQDGGVHIVRAGETLASIAGRYGVAMAELSEANGIANPNFIYAGQRLIVPGAGFSGGSYATDGGTVHEVQPGEGLATIAAQYGTTMAVLAQANGIGNPNLIYAGQHLVVPVSTSANQAALANPGPVPDAPTDGRWIDINLNTQTLIAYEGTRPLLQRLISSGLPNTPTPTGSYAVNTKLVSQRMTGPGYDLPNVPWVMYFTNRGHAIHGAYWHNNFGYPMSHGCVNIGVEDARWLYEFATLGTQVVVHY